MNLVTLILKIVRNGFIGASVVIVLSLVAVGLLLTNSEIKYVAQLAVISSLIAFTLEIVRLTVLKWTNTSKRGVTFNK